ncbi:MAG TPA: hypothetical protein VGG94_08455 [Chthoniobacterales bacterium]
MSLLRNLFWVALFLFFTFCFIVFFEYGSHDFVSGFKREGERVKSFVMTQIGKSSPTPSPAPATR